MDIFEDAFSDIEFNDAVAILRYDDREAKISADIFNYCYGETDKKEGPRSPEAVAEHKILWGFLKSISLSDVDVEIVSEEDAVGDGLAMILDDLENDCLFENLR